jgi:alanine racemase
VTTTESLAVQRIEIAAAALDHNLRELRALLSPKVDLLAVVKANAYGHGLDLVAPRASLRADWLGVHGAEEARQLRRLGITKPLLVMGFVPPGELAGLDADTHLVVSSAEALEWVGEHRRRSGLSLPVHLKVDIGTKRQGVAVDRIPELCRLAAKQRLDLVGVAGHFANIEDTIEHEFARLQLARFHQALEVVTAECGQLPPLIHASCSAAVLLFRETDFSLVRVGISMYGHWPSRETRLSLMLRQGKGNPELQPVLSWKAAVGQIQTVEAGESVGYGRSWTARRPSQLAVIPVGYADGYSRALGNRSRVLIRGASAPIVGRVCMNIMMADVTDIPGVVIGDEAVLIGSQGTATVTAEELAALSETINYELLARLSPAIPRVLV